ncbi:MAG: hypothetical protein HFF06_06035 [Oscillospiraceae bacterium]|jgi:hypothetical protein|nr:hypothetical protein [Oscillospiraceae bacterium]
MQFFHEEYRDTLSKLQAQGRVPTLTPKEDRWLEEQVQIWYEARLKVYQQKLKRVLNDHRLSNLEWAQKFGIYLNAMDRRDPRAASLPLKRFWRRKALEQKRWDDHRRKKFRRSPS